MKTKLVIYFALLFSVFMLSCSNSDITKPVNETEFSAQQIPGCNKPISLAKIPVSLPQRLRAFCPRSCNNCQGDFACFFILTSISSSAQLYRNSPNLATDQKELHISNLKKWKFGKNTAQPKTYCLSCLCIFFDALYFFY